MAYSEDVTNYIAKAAPEQIEILETLRQLIHEAVPGVSEAVKWRMPVFKLTKNFTWIQANKNHVTFGLYNANELQDPKGLLEGGGKGLRHVKIRELDDIDKAQFKKWLKKVAV